MLSRRVRWGVFIMLVKSSGKKKKKWKKIYHKSQSTNQFLSNRTTKWCPSKTGHAWSCAVLEIWKGSAHVSEPDHVFSLTKLSFSKWPNWPSPSTEPLRGVVLEVPRGCCCCTAEFSSSSIGAVVPRRCFEKRAVLISREGPSDGAKRMVMMSPRHHPSVLPLWFLIPRIVLMFVHPRDVLKPGRWFCLLSLAFMRAPICARPRFCN